MCCIFSPFAAASLFTLGKAFQRGFENQKPSESSKKEKEKTHSQEFFLILSLHVKTMDVDCDKLCWHDV